MSRFKLSPKALALVSSVLVLSLSAGYIALAWTEPTGTMPVTVAAPLNTGGVAQTKTGALALTGNLTAPIFYDADDPASTYYVNPSGQTVLAGLGVNGDIVLGGANEKFVFHPRTGTGDFLQITNQNAGGGWLWGQGITLRDSGEVGIGTIIPYSSLNIAGSGTNVSNKGIIVGTVGDSIATGVPLLGEVGRFEIGFPGWRDMEPFQIGAKIAAVRKNVYQPNSALVQGTDLAFYTGAGSTGNNPAFHDTSSEKMRITYDGKVVIDNGGQLCIGSACVASSTWATIVNNAGTGGGTIVIPISLYANPINQAYAKRVVSYDAAWDPSSGKLTVIGLGLGGPEDSTGVPTEVSVAFQNNLSGSAIVHNYIGSWAKNSVVSAVDVGVHHCYVREPYDVYPVVVCDGSNSSSFCSETNWNCRNYQSEKYLPGVSTPKYARTDGVYLYVFGTNDYSWKIDLSTMSVVDHGAGKLWPVVNGISLMDLGRGSIPYNHVIYKAEFLPSYSMIPNGTASYVDIVGYSSLLLYQIGSY